MRLFKYQDAPLGFRMRVKGLPLALILLAAPVSAHTQWKNGEPVPDWIKQQCCGPADAHHLENDQVHQEEGGFRIDGYPKLIPYNKLLPSHDGDWWAFYADRTATGGGVSDVFCFFGPLST